MTKREAIGERINSGFKTLEDATERTVSRLGSAVEVVENLSVKRVKRAAAGLGAAAVMLTGGGVALEYKEGQDRIEATNIEREMLAALPNDRLTRYALEKVGACEPVPPGLLHDELDKRNIGFIDDRCEESGDDKTPDTFVAAFKGPSVTKRSIDGVLEAGSPVSIRQVVLGDLVGTSSEWVETQKGHYIPALYVKSGEESLNTQ